MAKSDNNRRPTHDVCFVRGEGDKAYWTRIGAGWLHDDGKGLGITLDFVPLDMRDGRMVVRIRKEKTEGEARS